jgi:hypothetical protein
MDETESTRNSRENFSTENEIAFWMQRIQSQIPFVLNQEQQILLQKFLGDVLAPDQAAHPPGFRRTSILTLELTEAQQAEVMQCQQYQGRDYDLTRWNIARKLSGNSNEHEFFVEPVITRRIPKMF